MPSDAQAFHNAWAGVGTSSSGIPISGISESVVSVFELKFSSHVRLTSPTRGSILSADGQTS